MKKKLLLLITVLCPIVLLAQTKADSILNLYKYNDQGRVYFEKVFETDLSKQELFKNAKKWIAINYQDYKSVVQLEDEPNGIIIFKGISSFKDFMIFKYEYTVQVDIKDNKFRIKLYDIGNLSYSPGRVTPIEERINFQKSNKTKDPKHLIDEYNLFPNLIAELSIAMHKKDDF